MSFAESVIKNYLYCKLSKQTSYQTLYKLSVEMWKDMSDPYFNIKSTLANMHGNNCLLSLHFSSVIFFEQKISTCNLLSCLFMFCSFLLVHIWCMDLDLSVTSYHFERGGINNTERLPYRLFAFFPWLVHHGWSWNRNRKACLQGRSRIWKSLEFQLAIGQVALKFYLPWASPSSFF